MRTVGDSSDDRRVGSTRMTGGLNRRVDVIMIDIQNKH